MFILCFRSFKLDEIISWKSYIAFSYFILYIWTIVVMLCFLYYKFWIQVKTNQILEIIVNKFMLNLTTPNVNLGGI